LDDYLLTESATVLFGFDSVSISEDEQRKLDRVAETLNENIPYSVEIQGFTDGTGRPGYNLALSQKRADAVARYLTAEHKVPLRRIHILGMGSAEPTADNSTTDGRKLNRRVEVRLYVQKVVAAELQ
jgi:OOP family OmpA-OmpF porin